MAFISLIMVMPLVYILITTVFVVYLILPFVLGIFIISSAFFVAVGTIVNHILTKNGYYENNKNNAITWKRIVSKIIHALCYVDMIGNSIIIVGCIIGLIYYFTR